MTLLRKVSTLATLVLSLVLANTAHAEPALWVVKGPHATVYLFGSVHVLRKDNPWRTPAIDAAIKASDKLYLEIPDADDAQALQPLVMQLGVDREHPLSSKLTKEQLAHVDSAAKNLGLPGGETNLEPLRPWMAAITLSVFPMMKAGYDPASGVEQVLKPEFTKDHKPVLGFETASQQLHFFADLGQKQEVDYLLSSLDDISATPEGFNKIVDAWYAGDDKTINDLFNKDFTTKYPELYKLLIVQRNQSWMPTLNTLLKGEGTTFVAVGAGHIGGPDGVIALLTKAGYTVERK